MDIRVKQRLEDISEAIAHVDAMLQGKSRDALEDPIVRAALERFLEIVSEASRHVPAKLKSSHGPNLPWRNIADLGNILRHAYRNVDVDILWNIYANDLAPLKASIEKMLADN